MGYLTIKGKLLTYSEYKELCENYKVHGLKEFLVIYNAHKDRHLQRDQLHWGEEIEYTLFCFDPSEEKAWLTNQGFDLLQEFNEMYPDSDIHLQPEFGNWMVEAVPAQPYGAIENLSELLSCFDKLQKRRHVLEHYFTHHGIGITSVASPPMLGTPDHILLEDQDLQESVTKHQGNLEPINEFSQSRFVIDSTENPHPRFKGLMKSIRERRGEKVKILVPVYPDVNTNMKVPTEEEPFPGQIYMDSMHFGMGCSCIQVTFETQTINHARYLHDMLLPFTPILAALSASAPIYKGKLANIDLRWTVISQSVDCRNADERDPTSDKFIPKSRYSTINHYLSNHQYVKSKYMDTQQYQVNPEHVELLKREGNLDQRLAFHVASLFTRDPVPTYDNEHDETQFDHTETSAHFENLQSTNWNSMRFKPPPSKDSKIGWRVEFRPMDIQLTDYENAALVVLLGMINNLVNHFDVDFIMPISMIDENMERAHMIDAILNQKFWFRTNIFPTGMCYKFNTLEQTDYLRSHIKKSCGGEADTSSGGEDNSYVSSDGGEQDIPEDQYEELYLYEILEGKPSSNFVGIYSLIEEYLCEKKYPKEQVCQVKQYLDFLLARAKGQIPTGARYIRDFVINHADYKQDSIVSNKIAYDLLSTIINMNHKESEERAKFFGQKWDK